MERTIANAVFADESRASWPSVLDESGVALTFAGLEAATLQLRACLGEAGIAVDDRIATIFPRGVSGLLAFLAGSSEATCCPLHAGMRADEFEAHFHMLGVTIVLDGTGSAAVKQAADRLALPLITYEWADGALRILSKPRARSASRPIRGNVMPPGTALLMQTSGTTSKPKLVALTHTNILSAATGIVDWFALTPDDVCLNPMPLHHMHGLVTAGLASLLAGSSVCFTKNFSPEDFHEALETIQPTWFTGSPTMHLALRELYGSSLHSVPTRRLRFFRSSSAPLPASAISHLEEIFDAPLMETYGLTETASMICANPLPPAVRKVGSVGIAVGAEIRVVNEEGSDLAVGEKGEIVVRGPSVIQAYLGDTEVSAPHFFGEWLRTGDVGYLDSDGYLFIVGRTKELVKRGGLSVYPDEIDNVLVSHPSVAGAVTFGLPHPTLGEELVSVIVANDGEAPSEDELKAFLSRQLSGYKVPAAIMVANRIPKSETGKIVRRQMPEHFAAAFAPTNESAGDAQEAALLKLWQGVLGRSDFGVTDNLLLLGADPIRAGNIAEAASKLLGVEIRARDIISAPTVRAMATRLSEQRG